MSLKRTRCSVPTLNVLFETQTKDDLQSILSLSLANSSISTFPEPYIWALFPHLQSLDLSNCALADLPAAALARALPELVKLDFTNNLFSSLRLFVPFGRLRSLAELDLRGNPIPYLELRVPVLRELLFSPETTRVKLVKYLIGGYLRPNLQPPSPQAKSPKRSIPMHQFLHQCRRLPASLPRDGSFPMLSIFNAQLIMEDEIQSAKPHQDEDLVREKWNRNKSVTGKMRSRVSLHPCVERKERVQSVPRLFKIPDYVGTATLQPAHVYNKSPLIDRGDLHRLHRASHQELDFRLPRARKRFQIRIKQERERDSTAIPPSCPPSVAAEEDTLRQDSS